MKSNFPVLQKLTAFVINAAMIIPFFALSANAQTMAKQGQKSLTEDQKILHVLNRLGFGARAGDVEKVKAMGLKNYIEQQLNPDSINDSATQAKLQKFDALQLSNDELFAKYPNAQALKKFVAREEGLSKKDVSEILQSGGKKRKDANAEAMTQMPADDATEAQRREYQQRIAEIYKENNLGRPQDITRQLGASRIVRAVYSERQLQEQMVDFWTNHFNVYTNKAAVRWFLPEYDRDVIRPNALGNFRDLLLATAQSPAMLFYLDNFQSAAPQQAQNNQNPAQQRERLERLMNNPKARERFMRNQGITEAELNERIKKMQERLNAPQKPKRERGINENYAREIMELHTLGVEGGYSQKDIQEIARAFTGWTIINPRGYAQPSALMDNGDGAMTVRTRARRMQGIDADAKAGTFYFNERMHDGSAKTVLGQTINEGGVKDGLRVIDILANHPSTAKFIARKLAVKFVSDMPSEAFVGRIADAFLKSKGDIKTTLRAMFTDAEFYSPQNYRAKIKTPFEVLVSGIRAVNADTNGMGIQAMLNKMGEPLYGWIAPTGYPDTAEDWVNTGALLERMNYAVALASNRIPGTKANLSQFAGNINDKKQLLNHFINVLLQGEISDATRATLLKQLEQPLPEVTMVADDEMMQETAMMPGGKKGGKGQQTRLLPPSGNAEVFKVVGLILGSPEFQRQ